MLYLRCEGGNILKLVYAETELQVHKYASDKFKHLNYTAFRVEEVIDISENE